MISTHDSMDPAECIGGVLSRFHSLPPKRRIPATSLFYRNSDGKCRTVLAPGSRAGFFVSISLKPATLRNSTRNERVRSLLFGNRTAPIFIESRFK